MAQSFLSFMVFVVVALFILLSAIKVVQEYERGVVFRLGRFVGVRGPGLIILIPFVERMSKVDLRVVTLDVPTQEAITRDNITVQVNAVAYFFVLDPEKAVIAVEDFQRATGQIAQTTLRSVLGQHELDDLLARRERINMELQRIIDEATEPWGIKVTVVEIKDVQMPSTMQRAMAKQAEAERERRAKIIHAEGEYTASKQLAAAADVMKKSPGAMQLRYLGTLSEIAVEQNSTIIFPIPIEFLQALMPHLGYAPTGEPPTPVIFAPAPGTSPTVEDEIASAKRDEDESIS